jgi:hypothetical protein
MKHKGIEEEASPWQPSLTTRVEQQTGLGHFIGYNLH